MLATVERPNERLAAPTSPPIGCTSRSRISTPASPAPPGLRLITGAPPLPLRAVLELTPGRRTAELRGDADPQARLRLTMRARRLLAVLSLLGAVGIGVAAVDVLAVVLPERAGTSYAAQEAPYVAAGADSRGLVPASGSAITVEAGDTLWSLAEQVDPQADPRDLIAAIMTLNDLDSPMIVPGQVLRLP
ncbi:MAG: LysM peptidoglycan-binding domain-containing protein [Actinomycetota bacterium]|nr:LysM peptidoglycan-binding domain-containing protein [Actinomycetota bacterium]